MMKKQLLTVVVVLLAAICVQAQVAIKPYFSESELPDGVAWLPDPPDTMSTRFVYDITQYMWGKTIRETPRGKEATSHWVTGVEGMAKFFSEPFGTTISQEATPAIFKLLARSIPTFRLSVSRPKSVYHRKRPYVRYAEPTGIPWDEEREYNTGSYPSGHTIRGWGMALVLCEVNPDRQNDLLRLGYEWGQSRVIAGYHWQSDVDASRLMAAGVFARLHTSPEFMADMAAAQQEYQRITGKSMSSGNAGAIGRTKAADKSEGSLRASSPRFRSNHGVPAPKAKRAPMRRHAKRFHRK